MYYFIPSWYGQENFFVSDVTPWYFTQPKLEFDDVLHQMRIFIEGDMPACFIQIAYQPHARYFYHRQDILEMDCYSVFDDIQGIDVKDMKPLSITDFQWDEDCDFIYTPFVVLVEKNHVLHARIELGVEGFITMITYYKDNQPSEVHWMDDRGFVSSIVVYEDGQPAYREYLNAEGVWQVREPLKNDGQKVRLNPNSIKRFGQFCYNSIDELIWEFFRNFVNKTVSSDDCFVIAANLKHNKQLYNILSNQKKILSFFVDRNQHEELAKYQTLLPETQLVIVDRKDSLLQLQKLFPEYHHIMYQLPSFDTRLKLGVSQRQKESKIYYQLDAQEEINWDNIYQVMIFVATNPLTEVVFGFFNASWEKLTDFQDRLNLLVDTRLSQIDLERHSEDLGGAENDFEENRVISQRYQVVNMTSEIDLIQELEYTRLIVDLNDEPSLYTQIAGISTGVPQINTVSSEYVEHLKNGYIIKDLEEFPKAAHHFLDTLKYWNESLVYSVDKIRANTGQRFIEKWENWLKEEGNG